MSAHRVVIVADCFGRLHATRGLRGAPVEITLIDRRNFHLFQPLSYHVVTGALSPGEVAYPLRAVFKRNRSVRMLLVEVDRFNLERREVVLGSVGGLAAPEPVPYDTLIVAGGSHYSYVGHDTGPRIPPRSSRLRTRTVRSRIRLVEALDRVLSAFPPSLSATAERSLRRLGVTPVLGSTVVDVDETGVTVQDADGATRRRSARTVVSAAGVTASGIAGQLAEFTGAEEDRAGRVTVEADLTLPGHLEVFALGDMVGVRGRDGTVITFPGIAPVAIQQGHYAAKAVRAPPEGPGRSAVPRPRQGQPGHHRPHRRGRRHQRHQAQRLARLDELAARAPLLFGGLPERAARARPLVHELRHSRPRRPAHHESRERRRCRPSGGASRTIDASKRGLAGPMTGARKEPVVFVELDTRQDADDTVSLEWDRDTGETQIVVADIRDESLLVFPVPGANAGEAFRHPFRYAQ
jgi:NADH:ubiquinone reductase (H+-translocating)